MRPRPHHREKELARRGPRRETKHRILISCEGKKTEPRYFKELQHRFRNPLVHVEINDESGVPLTLVERPCIARELRRKATSTRQPGRNPTTNLDELTEKIRQGGQR